MYTLLRYAYTIFFILMIPFIVLRLYSRGRKNKDYCGRIKERFGFYTQDFKTGGIWLHAVSVGELMAARPLINKILAENILLTITTITPTASKQVQVIYADRVQHMYIPYDYPLAITRFLQKIQPKMVIIMETEIWPNLYYQLYKRKIPLILANARLASKSLAGYLKLKFFFKLVIQQVTCIAAQSTMDAQNFETLGALPQQIMVMGNIKYDVARPDELIAAAHHLRSTWNRPVWIAASTHPQEEELIIQSIKAIKQKLPDALCIIAPRHIERFDAVAHLCLENQLSIARRSKQEIVTATTDVFIADTLGELFFFYALSDVAVVCGSFAPIGGHNILEPALLGLPIIVGPETFHFKTIMQDFLAAKAILQIAPQHISTMVLKLLTDKPHATQMGQNAAHLVAKHQGAIDRLWSIPCLQSVIASFAAQSR